MSSKQALKGILVEINERPGAAQRAATAASLAASFGAELTGVFLRSDFLRLFMAGQAVEALPPGELESFLKERSEVVARQSREARTAFESAARNAGLAPSWLEIDGDSSDQLIAMSRRFDLTIVPPIVHATDAEHKIRAASLGLAIGGPILVLPQFSMDPPIGEQILVAWNGSRESARALRDALPLLVKARQVDVVVVSPKAGEGSDELLHRHLERHVSKLRVTFDHGEDGSIPDILRGHIERVGADTVVMGLYGRPRIQELVLGGVSTSFLRDPPAALFLSH